MDFAFNVLNAARKSVVGLAKRFPIEILNTIPNGYSNHLAWNIGHLVATQQLLTYGLSGNPFTVEQWVIDRFRKGAAPTKVSQSEMDYLLNQLITGTAELKKDYEDGVFKSYNEYPTSFGVTLSSIENAIEFNSVHDGIHLGIILAMRKAFIKPFNINGLEKDGVFKKIEKKLTKLGFRFERTDYERPWGGFFVIDETQALDFIKLYFPNEDATDLTKGGKVSPKILVVAPNKRLSWQYHHRRSEVWRVVEGKVGVIKSQTDEEGKLLHLNEDDKVILENGERHRLIGLDGFGIVAEIWQHTDVNHPSNEDDIVRLQDDFGR